jgi:hypothetical protein
MEVCGSEVQWCIENYFELQKHSNVLNQIIWIYFFNKYCVM